jgi:hypothetical protein
MCALFPHNFLKAAFMDILSDALKTWFSICHAESIATVVTANFFMPHGWGNSEYRKHSCRGLCRD